MVLYADDVLKKAPGSTIIGDVKCSQRLFDAIKEMGGKPIMWKTGHSLVKRKLKEEGAMLAGEMSGHIFFKENFYGFDDAPYCAARLASIVSNMEGKISGYFAKIPAMHSTPEIRVDCPEELKFKITEAAKDAFSDYEVDTTDGARISFEDGWGLVRASNTQPVLVMRFEASSAEKLSEYEKIVRSKIQEITSSLKA